MRVSTWWLWRKEGTTPRSSFTPSAGRALRTIYRDGGAQSALGSPPILFSEGRCVGGSTVINGGMCWRTPDHVLERWSSREGVADITPGAMASYFAKVERRINVAYQDPESIGHDQELLRQGPIGWAGISYPTCATSSTAVAATSAHPAAPPGPSGRCW